MPEPSDAQRPPAPSLSPRSPSVSGTADGGGAPTGLRAIRRRHRAPTAGADGSGPDTATAVAPTRRRWQGRSRRLAAGGLAVAVAVAGGLVAVAQRGSSAEAGYRTATVASRPVDQTLERVGTIEPVAQASVSFPVSGTVASVDVAVGDRVTVGQHLAQLDTTSLDSAVADARAELDQAELTLERALNGEDVSGGPAGGGSGSVAAAPASVGTGTYVVTLAAVTTAEDDPELEAAQQAVLAAQQQVDTDLATAQQALDDAQAICAALSTPEETADTTVPDGGDPASATSTGDDDVAACQSALVGVLDAQQVVAASQNALADASRALDQLLSERAENPGTGDPGTGDPGTGAPGGGGNPGGAGAPGGSLPDQGGAPQASGTGQLPSGGTGGGATTAASSPTSAELVAYQKDVDAAAAEVAVAEQAAAQATLISPIAGTVQQVGIAAGDTVTAGTSTAAVVVVGDGGYEVTTTVTVDDLPDLEPGLAVTLAADGTDEPAEGEVVGIGTVGTSSGSATTYPVTIGLHDPPDGLRNGSTASLSIVTARTDGAIAVPTSAVTVDGGQATVTVLDDGEPSEITVQTGAVGRTWTEITDGLEVGQTVVLADLDAPLPTSATDIQDTGGFGGLGNFGGTGPGL